MTPALRRMLQQMADAEDRNDWAAAEAVCSGLDAWVGDTQYSRNTVKAALRLVAVRDVSDDKGCRRYLINSVGRALLVNPEVEEQIRKTLLTGQAVTVRDNQVVPLELPVFD